MYCPFKSQKHQNRSVIASTTLLVFYFCLFYICFSRQTEERKNSIRRPPENFNLVPACHCGIPSGSKNRKNTPIRYQNDMRGHLWSDLFNKFPSALYIRPIAFSQHIHHPDACFQPVPSHLRIAPTRLFKANVHRRSQGWSELGIHRKLISDQRWWQLMESRAIFPQCTIPCHVPSDDRFSEVKGAVLQNVTEMSEAWHVSFCFSSNRGKMAPRGGYR